MWFQKGSLILLILNCALSFSAEFDCIRFDHDQGPFSPITNITKGAQKITKKIKLNETFEKKPYTLMVYIAADNDLHYFAWNNIKQLARGANKYMHIVVQLNEPGINKKTQIYLIEKNKAILLNKNNKAKLNSGDPKTLIDFCTYSIENFPADNYILDLSNHGSGSIDKKVSRLVNPTNLFFLNPANMMLELDRSIEFLDYLQEKQYESPITRGICFDETFHSYLSNQQLKQALAHVSNVALDGKKLSMVWMDACLMAGIEISALLKDYCNILIASEEVELGPGWRYDKVLKPFTNNQLLDEKEFAKHAVEAYGETYSSITNDYTLSAINLSKVSEIEENINNVGKAIELYIKQHSIAKKVIKKSKHKISFEEPSYIDLYSFYEQLIKNIHEIENQDHTQLLSLLKAGLDLIKDAIINNVAGPNIQYAKGVSIYLPEKGVHNSYINSEFAENNNWSSFICNYTNN